MGSSCLVTWVLLLELTPVSSAYDYKINNVLGQRSALVETNED